ncbi:MAG: hypothetical protein Q8T08_13260 [Ignavibacteria bacterium]|nr:hypothetical protein [Ignavibacteria bacterium]
MKKTTALIIWGIISLIPAGLAIILMVNLCGTIFDFPCSWLGFTYWSLTTMLVLLAIWMIYYSYLKWVEIQNKQQLKNKKLQLEEQKLEQEKALAELHNNFRIATDNNDYQLRMETAKNDNLLKSEAAKNNNLLKIIEKLSDRKETTKKKDSGEEKTITLSFRKELLDEVKAIKLKWDETSQT